MKLRNKKTGVIEEFIEIININNRLFARIGTKMGGIYKKELHSLAELNEEWEDYEEPTMFYWIDYDGKICKAEIGTMDRTKIKQIDNYFETKEEAEKAQEKLKAWKRLKDKGFVFKGINMDDGSIKTGLSKGVSLDDCIEFYEDMKLLFGGEE